MVPCIWWLIFLLLLSSFSLSFTSFLLSRSLCIYLTNGSCGSWMCGFMFLIKFDKILAIISSNIYSFPLSILFWDSHYTHVGMLVLVPQLWGSVIFLQFFFPLCSLDWIISIDLYSRSVTLSSDIFNLLLDFRAVLGFFQLLHSSI